MSIVDEIRNQKVQILKQGCEPTRLYLGKEDLKELVGEMDYLNSYNSYAYRQQFDGLTIYCVDEENHIKVI